MPILPVGYTVLAAFTDEFLQAFNNLGLDQWAGIEMDVAWGHATSQYGLHRPSITGPIFVYRVCTNPHWAIPTRAQVLTHVNLSPEQVLSAIAVNFPDLRGTWTEECYVLIHADDYWTFNQRPHGLVELVLGDRDLSFPSILPQMINFPIVQAFLAPLVPRGT